MTKLSFQEFEEMIKMVFKCHISDIDPQLKALENMSIQWYQGLGKVLVHKYPESLRSFSSTDGIIQHYVSIKYTNNGRLTYGDNDDHHYGDDD